MSSPHDRSVGVAAGALLASSATLVCCVLPAVLVAVGAGATLAGLVSTFPQLVWLSEHKALVFGVAGLLLVLSAFSLWRAHMLPCPVDPRAAASCARMRAISHWVYGIALGVYATGAAFAFVLPALMR